MRAVVFDKSIEIESHLPVPPVPLSWALIRVHLAGICGTDLQLRRGYRAFRGIPGHEFVGTVAESDHFAWKGKRVVGEINVGCGTCAGCHQGLQSHCGNRKVLGISGLDGCMADYCVLPVNNLFNVPDDMSDERAVFIEPLAAALEVIAQVKLSGKERAIILGDGPLGILCAWALSMVLDRVTLVGHHPEKLKLAKWRQIRTITPDRIQDTSADLVVEATGTTTGIKHAMALCRARGTIVLKSTVEEGAHLNLSPLVVNEITVVGSRCGPFKAAMDFISANRDMPLEDLISNIYPMSDAKTAFADAANGKTLKTLISIFP
jgi:threonine dehydrogenase-like Zn-dependent dehydrogenase